LPISFIAIAIGDKAASAEHANFYNDLGTQCEYLAASVAGLYWTTPAINFG